MSKWARVSILCYFGIIILFKYLNSCYYLGCPKILPRGIQYVLVLFSTLYPVFFVPSTFLACSYLMCVKRAKGLTKSQNECFQWGKNRGGLLPVQPGSGELVVTILLSLVNQQIPPLVHSQFHRSPHLALCPDSPQLLGLACLQAGGNDQGA